MKLSELGLSNAVLEDVDYTSIPEERGEFTPPLQPGPYVFELPSPTNLESSWEVIARNGEQRVQAVLTGESSLIAHLAGNATQNFSAWINNNAYPRGAEKIPVSDMQYLVRSIDPTATPKSNTEFVQVLNGLAGRRFKATVAWSAYCNPNKDVYFPDGEGNLQVHEGTKGCGTNYYQQNIPRGDDNLFIDRFECSECGATVRAFPRLRNFQPVE